MELEIDQRKSFNSKEAAQSNFIDFANENGIKNYKIDF